MQMRVEARGSTREPNTEAVASIKCSGEAEARYPERLVTSAQEVAGVWELESMSSEYPDGSVVQPLGEAPRGKLIYTADGVMAVQLGSSGAARVGHTMSDMLVFKRLLRRPWLIFYALTLLPALFRFFKTATRYISYTGTYTVAKGRILHHVQSSLFPDWEDGVLDRTASFDEHGRLVLVANNRTDRQRIVWRHMTKANEHV